MDSKIGWIDFSPTHKNRIKQFISIMNKGGVTDELGVGMVRDALSNLVFPGFSTVYTRAKYFFITPYLLHERNKAANREKDGLKYFNEREEACNVEIINYYKRQEATQKQKSAQTGSPKGSQTGSQEATQRQEGAGKEEESYFGKRKQTGKLERQPSSIYWNGIRTFKLVDTEMSLEQLLHDKVQDNDVFIQADDSKSRKEEMESTFEEGEYRADSIIKVTVPSDIQAELRKTGVALTDDEADQLTEHIIDNTPDSLVTAMLQDPKLWECYCASSECKGKAIDEALTNNFLNFTEQACRQKMIKNDRLYKNLVLAHDFSYFIHGAHIAYNIALMDNVGEKEKTERLREYGRIWRKEYERRMLDAEGFNIKDCLLNPNLPLHTRDFLTKYEKTVKKSKDWMSMEEETVNLAVQQEISNKGRKKSRFLLMKDPEEFEKIKAELQKEKWVGLQLINYRYLSTLTVMKDIYKTKEK